MPKICFRAVLFLLFFLIFLLPSSQFVSLNHQFRIDLNKLLKKILPPTTRVLTQKEEFLLAVVLTETLKVKVSACLEGQRLNHQWGTIGLEQYLPRYPGDTVYDREFPRAGITPKPGAWGYFVSSASHLTEDIISKEKYYVAVQTLYLPDWINRARYLKNWYKYRKMIVINPETGRAVVAVVADAGPAKWTGKQFGGSPQVMFDLGFYPKHTKGKVLVLFIDDPDDKIPLGPIQP